MTLSHGSRETDGKRDRRFFFVIRDARRRSRVATARRDGSTGSTGRERNNALQRPGDGGRHGPSPCPGRRRRRAHGKESSAAAEDGRNVPARPIAIASPLQVERTLQRERVYTHAGERKLYTRHLPPPPRTLL